jgi:hypothetical protein
MQKIEVLGRTRKTCAIASDKMKNVCVFFIRACVDIVDVSVLTARVFIKGALVTELLMVAYWFMTNDPKTLALEDFLVAIQSPVLSGFAIFGGLGLLAFQGIKSCVR